MVKQEVYFITALMIGAVSSLVFGIANLVRSPVSIQSEDASPVSVDSNVSPAILPNVSSEKDCRKRSDSVWDGEECMDIEYDPLL